MKYLYSVIIIFVFSVNAGATERAYHNYIYSNLNFSFCYNFTSHDPVEYLYYRGLSTLLNEYIKEKIENGDLDKKKLEIQAGCTLFGIYPAIEISRNKNGYFVFIHGDTNLNQLVRIVNYFASKDWESFCYNYENVSPKVALKLFNTILDKVVGTPQLEFIENKSIKVWEVGSLQITYKPDELFYQFNEKVLNFKPSNPLPAKLQDRYFYVINNKIQVVEEDKIILEQTIPDYDDIMPYLYTIESYWKWLNVYYREDPILSYSYAKNRFYKIQNDNRIRNQMIQDSNTTYHLSLTP